jgi:mono/diheme cytochrome c family protein
MKIRTGITLVAMMAATMTTAFAQSGADNYKAKCAMCHSADGSASGPVGKSMKIPAFNAPEANKMSEADIITVIKNGKGKMTGYAGKLTDAQIKDVAGFVKTLQK